MSAIFVKKQDEDMERVKQAQIAAKESQDKLKQVMADFINEFSKNRGKDV